MKSTFIPKQPFDFLLPVSAAGLLFAVAGTSLPAVPEEERLPNILFISIDDLNNDLGILGVAHAQTPALDQFAGKARLFTRHYVQVPTCGASRAALLSGLRPSSGMHIRNQAILNLHEEWGERNLPGWFRQHGYRTLALGKIGHYPGGLAGADWAEGPEEMPGFWDRIWVPDSPWETPEAMMHGYANGKPRDRGVSPPIEAYDGPDTAYPDGWVAKEAVEVLEDLSRDDTPWFFAVGYFKPHLPFAAPKRWWDIHDPENIPAPPNPERAPPGPSSYHPSGELMSAYGGHDGKDPRTDPDYARTLRHGYAASVSYVDAQVGKLLDQVDNLGLADNTIIVIWSDHGFSLGSHETWAKHSLYEEALLCPLIIRYPGMDYEGRKSSAIVETLDIFPTLIELSGLPEPDGLDGRSLVPQLVEPEAPSGKPALAWWRGGQVTVRVDDWRLIAHLSRDDTAFELFDFRELPYGKRASPEDHPAIMEKLRGHLKGIPTFDIPTLD